jgi:cysteine sulfinate desulfinase/cysteine desulfurase-like protein
MGLPGSRIKGSLRFSLGHTTTEENISMAVDATVKAAERLLAVQK